jgi:hypothetical protein
MWYRIFITEFYVFEAISFRQAGPKKEGGAARGTPFFTAQAEMY